MRWQENEWMITVECGRCDDWDMYSTMGTQSRNRVGRREWTSPQMGEVFNAKVKVFMCLEVEFWLMIGSYQGLRDRVQERSTDTVLLSKKNLHLRRGSVECWGNLEWREEPGHSCSAFGNTQDICSHESDISSYYKLLLILCHSRKVVMRLLAKMEV